jgi:hypothetical protein
MELSSSPLYLVRIAQTTGEYLGRDEGDCMEGATPAAQALYEIGCSRQESGEDRHGSCQRTAGLHLGHWNKGRNGRQPARRGMTTGNKSKKLSANEKKAIRSMNITANFEHRAGSSPSKHEGKPSFALCDRPSRIRDNSQRQLPTDHDYAVPTREYQTDQSSLNLPRLLLALSSRRSKNNYKNHPQTSQS